jgi:anti-sigma regulatory factor (Ser/Thr protein kinase)
MTVPTAHAPTRPAAHTGPSSLPASTRPGLGVQERTLLLGPGITAPRRARTAVTEALAAWGMPHLADDAAQITSELVANAVAASAQGAGKGTEADPVTLTISITDGEFCIRVWDPDPTAPPRTRQDPGTWTERGRGLLIVEELSTRWGWYPGQTGKYVWSVLPLSQPPAGRITRHLNINLKRLE